MLARCRKKKRKAFGINVFFHLIQFLEFFHRKQNTRETPKLYLSYSPAAGWKSAMLHNMVAPVTGGALIAINQGQWVAGGGAIRPAIWNTKGVVVVLAH